MPAPRPTTVIVNLTSPRGRADTYVSTCKFCRAGVFKGEAYSWLTSPMGLSHDGCVELARKEGRL